MDKLKSDEIRRAVRDNYGKAASAENTGCCCSSSSPSSCCGSPVNETAEEISMNMGYSAEEVLFVPEGANLGLGCGNPQTIAALKAGETVLDLGSGGGFDSFLAARAVGDYGYVIGVDMTPQMISKSRINAEKIGLGNVEFRLGEIENLPVADGIVDVIISNCVINLSPEKERVFEEAYRVLKPGGRLAISDIVQTAEMPEGIKNDMAMYTGCVSGASSVFELEPMLQRAGFKDIRIRLNDESKSFIRDWIPGSKVEDYIASATIEAVKP